MTEALTSKRREILEYIAEQQRVRGFPPSVREIGQAVGLASSSTVHSHLKTLQEADSSGATPTKPRAIEVRYDSGSGAAIERRPVHHVPLVGDVAAGTDVLAEENVEELIPVADDLTGGSGGQMFMVRVRGDSMIEAGILAGDLVVVRQGGEVSKGDVVVAGIPGGEATVEVLQPAGNRITLNPANSAYEPLEFHASEVEIYGKVVTVLRRL